MIGLYNFMVQLNTNEKYKANTFVKLLKISRKKFIEIVKNYDEN